MREGERLQTGGRRVRTTHGLSDLDWRAGSLDFDQNLKPDGRALGSVFRATPAPR